MGRRRYKRQRITLPVPISGLDQNGNRFTQSASIIEIAANGVRLRGVCCLRQVGQSVEIEYRRHHARYRVAWIGAIGTCWEGMVGLEGMAGARQLFADHLPALSVGNQTDSYQFALEPAACPNHGATGSDTTAASRWWTLLARPHAAIHVYQHAARVSGRRPAHSPLRPGAYRRHRAGGGAGTLLTVGRRRRACSLSTWRLRRGPRSKMNWRNQQVRSQECRRQPAKIQR